MQIISQIKKDLEQQIKDFSLHSPQTRLALQSSFAVIVAVFLSVLLQTQEPYWAGISAFISTQPTVGNTLSKSLERMIGTLIGAITALIIVSLFITQPIIFSISLFLLAFIGIYFTATIENKTYTWMFFYITGIMVLLAGLNNPTPENFINMAFFRSLEIIIGVFSSCVISLFLTNQYAHKQLTQSLIELLTLMISLNETNKDYITQTVQQRKKEIQQKVESILEAIRHHQIKQDQLLLFAQHEMKSKIKHAQQVDLITSMRDIISLLMNITHHHYLNDSLEKILSRNHNHQTQKILFQFQDELSAILKNIKTTLENEQDISHVDKMKKKQLHQSIIKIDNSLNDLDNQLFNEQNMHRSNDQIKKQHDTDCQLTRYDWLHSLKSIQNEAKQLIFNLDRDKLKTDNPLHFNHPKKNYFHYDTYYFKHALIGATAILFVPFIWLYFNLPGYYQIAVSIAVCFNLSSETSRNKGILRVLGCLIGSLLAIFILTLSIDNFTFILSLLFFVTFYFGLIHFSNTKSMSLGTQASVVFIIGIVNQLTPITSLAIPIERLSGIFLGVLSVIIFQALFWPYQQQDKIKHSYTSLLTHFNQYLEAIFSNVNTSQSIGLWDTKGQYSLYHLKQHLINFMNLENENNQDRALRIMTNTQTPLRFYYSIFHFLMITKDRRYTPFFNDQDNHKKNLIKKVFVLLAAPINIDSPQKNTLEYNEIETQLKNYLYLLHTSRRNPTQPLSISPIEANAFYLSLLNLCRYKHKLIEENNLIKQHEQTLSQSDNSLKSRSKQTEPTK
ncbi:FUSC family protein [uncultured Shewanella sp.]|uniref:FUSC family protein n=1 Tax=uncultured Shewanella sp. TaxID=173975 RepID=UPI0026077F54|nr:FUSC family protein [uncultured Shewanella sp.]